MFGLGWSSHNSRKVNDFVRNNGLMLSKKILKCTLFAEFCRKMAVWV